MKNDWTAVNQLVNTVFFKSDISKVNCLQHLLLVGAVQIPPLLDRPPQVDRVHGNLHVSNDVMFGKSVVVINGHDQSLPAELLVGHLMDRHEAL